MSSKPNYLVDLRRPEALRRWASTLGMSPNVSRSATDTARGRGLTRIAGSTATQKFRFPYAAALHFFALPAKRLYRS